MSGRHQDNKPNRPLRTGWTTGACATAAAKAAYQALLTGAFPDPVTITLPRGGTAAFALATEVLDAAEATAAIVKDAGEDPDVTHGALVRATVRRAHEGVIFRAGIGVGTVTRPGLPLPVGEPAINPVPREMITTALTEVAAAAGLAAPAAEVTISIPGGEALAAKTWNPRLGIIGGLSVLGTTGIVTPYSCAAWIHSIHRGVDVARAAGLTHIAAATGSTSERAVQAALGLPDIAMIDMGDFAGGLLKYLARHPVPRLTIAGGFAKLTKLAAGSMDLHSSRSQVDLDALAAWAGEGGPATPTACAAIAAGPTAMAAREAATAHGIDLAAIVAARAKAVAMERLSGAPVGVDVIIVDRQGGIVAHG
ncbi:cobalt-precorrin-5B (C(1))-methyltransferase [Acuticoccus yangtzensis]|uniref:cobalt-precorrin-5B (C(1))-methyltransferase n=1 Tax=Acuticoccus yangtzensis TaxID=1443441 RepID=UPI000949A4F6|nr:cobalt-precorrin-5B (C(1))-methyltransferase [Acuticoccus yangtzensis]